jgi:hypothetical protein
MDKPERKLCTYKGHVLDATAEYFYRDNSRRDGFDAWCKTCRKEAKNSKPRTYVSDQHTGPIVLRLPNSRAYPATKYFSSDIRKMADEGVNNGREVVVTTQFEAPVWKWRQWMYPRWETLDHFFEETLHL